MNFSRYTSAELNAAPASDLRLRVESRQFFAACDDSHPTPAAAVRRFQNDGIPNLFSDFQGLFRRRHDARRPGRSAFHSMIEIEIVDGEVRPELVRLD